MKLYSIQTKFNDDSDWRDVCGWSALRQGEKNGAIMVLDSFYGGNRDYRVVDYHTKEVVQVITARKAPTVN